MRLDREPLIELRHVDVDLAGSRALRDVTWSLRPGEHWMIRGANGSGKSTFLRLLRGDVWPAPNAGERLYRFDNGVQTTAIEVRPHIALVSPELQERYLQQEWQMTGRDVIQTGFAQTDFLYTKLSADQRQRVEEISLQLDVAPLLARDVQTLSTGELRKVLIARAVVGAPAVLLLDEVCDGLDARFRRGLLKMLETIAVHGCQLVYTTHRADEGLSLITHELLFDQGGIARQGPLPARQARARNTGRTNEGKTVEPVQRRTDLAARGNGSPLIRIENAEVFLDRIKILHGIHWELRRGEHWAVLGGNGAGKTTFLKLVASDLYAAFGARVSRFEITADDTIWDLRRRIGCVSPLLQTHYRERLTGEQVVCSGFFSSVGLRERPSAAQRRKAQSLLKAFQLEHLRARSMLSMSFGELRKILTLRALVHDPELVIFDEPFDGLDDNSKRDFASALEKVAARGAQLLIVTHHLDDLPSCITHGLVLESGRIMATGRWPAIRRHEKVVELFGR